MITTMTSDQNNSEPAVENTARELTAKELAHVTGGAVAYQDFHFVKKVDKSTPVLFQ